jgi:hypothetical protein
MDFMGVCQACHLKLVIQWEIPEPNGGFLFAGKIIEVNGGCSIAMFD